MKIAQPPSGGCVLKPIGDAFLGDSAQPAAFGRLCVETAEYNLNTFVLNPAAFGRLCVETLNVSNSSEAPPTSRLRAAVC